MTSRVPTGWRPVWRWKWATLAIRHKLLTLALLPLLVVLPLLIAALVLWGNAVYDRLLITRVRSDLAVARGYFGQVLSEVGSGTRAVATSQALAQRIASHNPATLDLLLANERERLGFDFFRLDRVSGRDDPAIGREQVSVRRMSARDLLALAPHLASRLHIALLPTPGAAPGNRTVEDRALVMLASSPVQDGAGRVVAVLHGGVLLNQNLAFIDHINRIVYPEGSLPFGSHGTATIFLDNVRVTTNVRLFQDQRAIGTRVSQAVRDAVLVRGQTWLDRAFVVNDWYVSAYEPLLDDQGQRVGMLYVGYLEVPFRQVKFGILALIVAIFVMVMMLAAWLSVRWARTIFHPLERMNKTMHAVEAGDTGARVGLPGAAAGHDEIAALAVHLDHLLDVIDDKTRALQAWAQELDAKVAQRTQELAQINATLRQTQQQLVKSEKLAAIGQLTASIAHEINNPIAVIQGNLDLMRETLGPEARDVEGELRLLDAQVERMRLIVTQLLQYARPTEYAGYVEPVDVNRVIDDCLVLVGHQLSSTRIDVVRALSATCPAGINRQELQQVVINLLINAIQAMPAGGSLLLQTRDRDDAPGVELDVRDTGSGLSGRIQSQLFSPFRTTKNDGNGLGLWISQSLLERYGASIEAWNRQDRGENSPGACFRVRLLAEPTAPSEPAFPPH